LLAPGDVIQIVVWKHPEYSGEFLVASDGSIVHPLYRQVRVAGVSLATAETRIREVLTRYEQDPTLVVSALLRVVVGGEVRQPNVYTAPMGTTVAQAIALANGPTDRGRLDQVQILRQGQRVNLDLTGADSSAMSFTVHSGDQIIVARGTSFMRDVLAPASSVIAALAAVVSIIVQTSR
jgi:polysaccharide export outer membrane protein